MLLVVLLVFTGCTHNHQSEDQMPAQDIVTVMNSHVDRLMATPGVVMVAVGQLPDSTPCIQVYAKQVTPELKQEVGLTLDGYPVDFIVSDDVRPLN